MATLNHIKYMTFDNLMSSVESDLYSYADAGMVDRSKFIKTIRKVNSDLGIRINKEKEIVIEIKNHRAILPDDFLFLQLALLCREDHNDAIITPSVDPAKLVNKVTHRLDNTHCDYCPKECPCGTKSTMCGHCYTVYEYQPMDVTIKYTKNTPIKLTPRSHRYCADSCFNTSLHSDKYKYTLDVDDNVITLEGIANGKLYISYLTDMTNEDGDLLLVDHPLLNDYYEYSVKERLLENFLMNNDADVSQKLQYIISQKKIARIDALNFVNMPEYTEILEYTKARTSNFYNRYFKIFE